MSKSVHTPADVQSAERMLKLIELTGLNRVLLDALEAAEKYISHHERNLAGHEDDPLLQSIRGVIAKAKGLAHE